jgi:putative chitinase
MINRDFFFDHVRTGLFESLQPTQVKGLTGILDEWDAHHASKDDRWLAYMLATTHHETDRKFRPIREYGSKARFTDLYDVTGSNPARAKKNGNTAPGDGARYCGRGFVQLTWKNNYAAMGKVVKVDLVANPDRALDLGVATTILFHGMMKGSFTGKKLGDYFAGATADWVNARRIINGTDKASLVSSYAKQYYAALSHTT